MTPAVRCSAPVADRSRKVRAWLTVLGGAFIACFFLFFTWRGLLVYYTGDDLMNLYGYWSQPVSALVKANFFFWTPYYRPFGGGDLSDVCSPFSALIRTPSTWFTSRRCW